MNDPNRTLKWLLLMALIVLAIMSIYPPSQRLKGGIDLVGGTSLLFEVDTAGLTTEQQRGLSTKVMGILKDRVDPKQQMNLEWRPVGNTRLEIRMPRPPAAAVARREAFNAAQDRLSALNISRFDVETALAATGAAREAALKGLVKGITEREALLTEVAKKYDDYLAAETAGDDVTVGAASAAYEQAMSGVLGTNLPVGRLLDVLGLAKGEKRDEELAKIKAKYPSYDAGGILSQLVKAHDEWAVNKADLEDPSDLKRRIRGSGVLEFRILADRSAVSPGMTGAPAEPIAKYTEQLAQQGPRARAGDKYRWFPIEDVLRFTHAKNLEEFERIKDLPTQPIIAEYTGQYYVLMHNEPDFYMLPGSTPGRNWKLTSAMPDQDPMTGENVVSFTLDARGGRLFGELTGGNVKRQLCIILDGRAMSHATINERITERCQIRGRFRAEQVADLVRILEAGSLPARLKETPLAEKTIGPSLGDTNRKMGMRAVIWGGALVAVFVLVYYGLVGGSVADLALVLNLLFTLALMSLMNATFTLPGLAGLILTVGMAVDANVLIFERIREERARGVVFKKALNAGYDRAFSAIFDGNLTTLLTCVFLGFIGSEEVRGFAITLGLGLVTSMFTALTVTRLIFNTMIAKGWLSDLRMMKLIGVPAVDWVGMRRIFWPISLAVVTLGLTLFLWRSTAEPETLFDIEFLGGTSVQIDLKAGLKMNDEEVRRAVSATEESSGSAVAWLRKAAGHLLEADIREGTSPGHVEMESAHLTADQLATLMRPVIEGDVEPQGGISLHGRSVTFVVRTGALNAEGFRNRVREASALANRAAENLRGAKVQSVGAGERGEELGHSFEVVTIETNRGLVQTSIIAALGEKLNVERALNYTLAADESMTRAPYHLIETEDQYLSDVLATTARFDIRRYRGGLAIEVKLDDREAPLPREALEKRLREVALQAQYEQYRSQESTVFPLDEAVKQGDVEGHRRFAVVTVDEQFSYDDDRVKWEENVALPKVAQVEAALGTEKSLSKVLQFAPQVAKQAKNKALLGIVLSLLAIGAYVWLRFGNREFGLAVIVTLVHDVAVTLGMIAIAHAVYDSFLGRALLIEDFRIDLAMVAAILTIIGYSLNDTIVVFDRIRENRGKSGALSATMINTSINQTLSRTILTSFTVFIVILVLYLFGGTGVHGFAFAMIVGTISGTYSTLGIAVPLVYRPRVLLTVWILIATLLVAGLILAQDVPWTVRGVAAGAVVVFGAWRLIKGLSRGGMPAGMPAPA